MPEHTIENVWKEGEYWYARVPFADPPNSKVWGPYITQEIALMALDLRGEWGERVYVTGHGQLLTQVHYENELCQSQGCCIHNPTDAKFPSLWREDRALMERVCTHGVGHPDRDHIGFVLRTRGEEQAAVESVHGCCGGTCCWMSGEQKKQ